MPNILNFIGNETGNSLEYFMQSGNVSIQSSIKRTGTYAVRVLPAGVISYFGFQGLAATGLAADLPTTWYFDGYLRIDSMPLANLAAVARAGSIATTFVVQIMLDSNGDIYLHNGTTGSAVAATLTTGQFYHVQFKPVVSGTCSLSIDGGTPVTLTGGSGVTATTCYLGCRNSTPTYDIYWDDCCVADDDYPGAGECKISVPIGAGAASGWTAGTNSDDFNEVDEIPHDTDTTYIAASATQDNLDHTFDMQAAATIGIAGAIGAVKTMVVARTDSISGSSSVAHRRLFNGSGFELTALELTTTYQILARIDIIDPSAGGGAITLGDFDSIEVGMAANTIGQVQRFTAAYLSVWSTGAAAGIAIPVVLNQFRQRGQ